MFGKCKWSLAIVAAAAFFMPRSASAQHEELAWKYSTYGNNYILLQVLDGNAFGATSRLYPNLGMVYSTYAKVYQFYYGDDYGYSYYAFYYDYLAYYSAWQAYQYTGHSNYYEALVCKYHAYNWSYKSM